jgi:hypothetical protein
MLSLTLTDLILFHQNPQFTYNAIDLQNKSFIENINILTTISNVNDVKQLKTTEKKFRTFEKILVEKYGTYTAVNGQIRAVYAPYCYRNPGRWFTTVCNENTVCIRAYTAQNAVLYTVPIYDDQDYGEIRPVFVPYLIVNGRIRRSYD